MPMYRELRVCARHRAARADCTLAPRSGSQYPAGSNTVSRSPHAADGWFIPTTGLSFSSPSPQVANGCGSAGRRKTGDDRGRCTRRRLPRRAPGRGLPRLVAHGLPQPRGAMPGPSGPHPDQSEYEEVPQQVSAQISQSASGTDCIYVNFAPLRIPRLRSLLEWLLKPARRRRVPGAARPRDHLGEDGGRLASGTPPRGAGAAIPVARSIHRTSDAHSPRVPGGGPAAGREPPSCRVSGATRAYELSQGVRRGPINIRCQSVPDALLTDLRALHTC